MKIFVVIALNIDINHHLCDFAVTKRYLLYEYYNIPDSKSVFPFLRLIILDYIFHYSI